MTDIPTPTKEQMTTDRPVPKEQKHLYLDKLKQDKTHQYTPEDKAIDMIHLCDIEKDDIVLDPSAGDNKVFYNNFPTKNKEYCEIEEGTSFLDYEGRVDWVIGNIPYRFFIGDIKYNGFPTFMEKSLEITNKGIGFLISHKIMNALTVTRLKKWQPFNITKIKIYEVKQWYGRYFFLVFEKDKESIIDF